MLRTSSTCFYPFLYLLFIVMHQHTETFSLYVKTYLAINLILHFRISTCHLWDPGLIFQLKHVCSKQSKKNLFFFCLFFFQKRHFHSQLWSSSKRWSSFFQPCVGLCRINLVREHAHVCMTVCCLSAHNMTLAVAKQWVHALRCVVFTTMEHRLHRQSVLLFDEIQMGTT